MKGKRFLSGALLLLFLMVLPASAAFADGPRITTDDGRIFVDEDVLLQPGEVFDGDLGIFNGDLSVPASGVIQGDVFVTNGDVNVSGRIDGSLAVIGGELILKQEAVVEGDLFVMSGDHEIAGRVMGDLSVMFGDGDLRDSAIVDGDLMVLSGTLARAAGARVGGEELRDLRLPNLPLLQERRPEVPAVPRIGADTPAQQFGRFVGRVLMAGFVSVVFVALGLLIVFIWPRRARRVTECIETMPVQSFVLGLLTFLIAAVLEAIAAVLLILIVLVGAALIGTVILIPIGLLLILLSVLVMLPVPLALIAGMMLGWVSLAQLIGQKIGQLLRRNNGLQPMAATLVGLLITVPVAALLWILKPVCCAWPFVILLTSLGLGAVLHTRFGKQACSEAQSAAAPEVFPAEAMDDQADAAEVLPAEAMDDEAGEPDQPPDTAS